MIGVKLVPPHFQCVWNSSCQSFFFQMLLHERLHTRNLLQRKTFFLESCNCATLHCQIEKTLQHLFWICPFVGTCWDYVCPSMSFYLSIMEAFGDLKQKQNVPFSWKFSSQLHGRFGLQGIISYSKISSNLFIGGKRLTS